MVDVDRIGKYQILGQIGRGAMGVVYKAFDRGIDRTIAIKMMSGDLQDTPELHERFLREARAAGRLAHKNIVTIYELGEDAAKVYLAMEFLDGEDLGSVMGHGERIPLEIKLHIMTEVLEGLAYAHKMGVVHRDIKPGNIFVASNGDIKILDFGLARVTSSDLTRTRGIMGTPNYMSPEQIRSDQTDHRSDLFSAGAAFYELLTLRKPFAASSLPSTMYRILEVTPDAPHQVDPVIPEELSRVIMRVLDKDPNRRYQSAQEMLADLRRIQARLAETKTLLRRETDDAIAALHRLVDDHRDILGDEKPKLPDAQDYTALLALRELARQEALRLNSLVEAYRNAAPLLDEARALEESGQFERAIGTAQRVPPGTRLHAEAASLIERARTELRRRAQVASLLAQARGRLEAGELARARELLAALLDLDPSHGEAAALLRDVDTRLEEERKRREAERQAQALFQTAELLLAEGDLEGADTALREVLALDPHHGGARELAARVQARRAEQKRLAVLRELADVELDAAKVGLDVGDLVQARACVERALKICPDAADLLEMLRRVEAAEQRQRAKEEKDRKVRELLDRSRELFQAGDDDEALRPLDTLLGLDPSNSTALRLQRLITDRREAAARAERARRTEIASLLLQSRRARHSGDFEQAIQTCRSLLARYPDHPRAKKLLNTLEQQQARKLREDLERRGREALASAQAFASKGESGQAVAALEHVDADVRALPSVGEALERYREEFRIQEEARLRAEQERAEKVRSLLDEARKAQDRGDLNAAIEAATSALQTDPKDEILTLIRALQQERARIRKVEREELERKTRELLSRADALAGEARHEEAISLLREAEPTIAFSGAVQENLKRFREALQLREEARLKAELEKRRKIAGLMARARDARLSGNLDNALELTRAVLEHDSQYAEAQQLLGQLQTQSAARTLIAQAEAIAAGGRLEQAVDLLAAADPAIGSLVEVRQSLKRFRESIRAREEARLKAQREKQERLASLLNQARDALKSRDSEKAADSARAVVREDPDHEEGRELLRAAEGQISAKRAEEELRRKASSALESAEKLAAAEEFEQALAVLTADSRIGALEPVRKAAERYREAIGKALRRELERKGRESLRAAEASAARGEFGEAIAILERAEPAVMALPEVRTALERYREQARNQEAARRRAEQERAERTRSLLDQARKAQTRGDLEKAIGFATSALQFDSPDEAVALLRNLQQERARIRETERAERERKTLELLSQADALAAREHHEEAISLLENADTAIASSDALQDRLKRFREVVGLREEARLKAELEKKEKIEDLMARAQKAREAGNLEDALALTRSVLEADGGHADGRRVLEQIQIQIAARKLIEQADSIAARDQFEQAVAVLAGADPEVAAQAEVRLRLARYQQSIRARDEARRRAEREREEKLASWLKQARVALKSGDPEKAADCARAVLKEHPSQEEAQQILRGAESEIETRRAEEELRRKASPILGKAEELAAAQQFEQALAVLAADAEVAALEPARQAANRYRDALNEAVERRREEVRREQEARERALETEERMASARNAFDRGNHADCEQEVGRVLSLDPNHRQARELLEKARRSIRRQLEEQAQKQRASQEVSAARKLLASGKPEAALASVDRASALDPDNSEAAQLRGEIEEKQVRNRELLDKRRRAQELLSEASRLLAASDPGSARRALGDALSLWPELPGAAKLRGKVDREEAKARAGRSGSRPARATRFALFLVVLVLVAVAAVSLLWLRPRSQRQAANAPEERLAKTVLPPAPPPAPIRSAPKRDVNPPPPRQADSSGPVLKPPSPPPPRSEGRRDLATADAARSEMKDANTRAEAAGAASYAADTLRLAKAAGSEAEQRYQSGDLAGAAGRFREASDLYRRSETEARTGAVAAAGQKQKEEQIAQVTNARKIFEAALPKAAGADRIDPRDYGEAQKLAEQAGLQFERGDYLSARGSYEQALSAIERAAANAATEAREWESARTRSDVPALQTFVQKYPNGRFAQAAAERIEQLEWDSINKKDAAAINAYLQKHPTSPFASQARSEMDKVVRKQRIDADDQAIRGVLRNYENAFTQRNPNAVQGAWPDIPAPIYTVIKRSMKTARSISLKLTPEGAPVISEDAAEITCRREFLQTFPEKPDLPPEHDVVKISLHRKPNAWVITSIEVIAH